jgi:hypothetical protein
MQIRFHRNPLSVPNLLLIAVFTAAAFGLCTHAFYAIGIVTSGDPSIGNVTSIERRGHRRSAPYYHFSYSNSQGQVMAAVTKYPCFFLSQGPGDTVPIRIRKDSAELSSMNYLWGAPAIFLCITAFIGWIAWRWCRENLSIFYN